MADSFFFDTEESIDLESFISYVNNNIDMQDPASVATAAIKLKKLGNNRNFLVDAINADLLSPGGGQNDNPYSAQSFLLARSEDFLIRANFWTPPTRASQIQQHDLSNVYEKAHCHNFNLLTVGYYGAGYETVIYEYDRAKIQGFPGEHAPLRFLERTRLSRGKVMFFRPGRDVHVQLYPEEFSISLNLIGIPPRGEKIFDQFNFDIKSQQIVSFLNPCSRSTLIRMAASFGNAVTSRILSDLRVSHYSPRVRLASLKSLSRLEPGSIREIWSVGLKDSHPLVRQAARRKLDQLGTSETEEV